MLAGGLGEVVLLTVRSYEMIEPEFPECTMKQVSGPEELGQPTLFGSVSGNIDSLVVEGRNTRTWLPALLEKRAVTFGVPAYRPRPAAASFPRLLQGGGEPV